MTKTVTVEQSVEQLVNSVEDFARRANPKVREIFITQEVDAIREKWNIPAQLGA